MVSPAVAAPSLCRKAAGRTWDPPAFADGVEVTFTGEIAVDSEGEFFEREIAVDSEAELFEREIAVDSEAELFEREIAVDSEAELFEREIAVDSEAELFEREITVDNEAELFERELACDSTARSFAYLISSQLTTSCDISALAGGPGSSRQLRKAWTFRSSATGTYEQGARDSGSEACAGGCAVPGGARTASQRGPLRPPGGRRTASQRGPLRPPTPTPAHCATRSPRRPVERGRG